MMNATEEMRAARWELKMLTASDRAATSNMLRHVVAVAIMLAGRRQKDKLPGEPEIGACFLLDADDRDFMMHITARTKIDQIHVGFDVADASGPARGIGVTCVEGEEVASYGTCRLWAPASDGRAVLVPMGDGASGYFSFRKGGSLKRLSGRPATDLEPGFRRAVARLSRLLASAELRDVGREGFFHVISNDDGELSARATSLAA